MRTPLENAIAASNPVQPDDHIADGSRATATLARLIDSSNTPRPTRRLTMLDSLRVWPVAATAAAVAIFGAVLLLGPDTSSSYVATPVALKVQNPPDQKDADRALRDLANRTAAQTRDIGSGNTAEVNIRSWSLFTRIDGRQVTSEVVPMRSVTRITMDGTATVSRSYSYEGEHNERFTTEDALDYPLRGLSAEPTALRRQLTANQPEENGTAGLFDSIVVANRQMPLEPAVRAAVLQVLAATGDVSSVGRVEDRAGRAGLGFTVDSAYSGLPTRYMLIFDSENGRLLSYEELLTTDAGKLNVRVPAVIQYQVFEDARYVQ